MNISKASYSLIVAYVLLSIAALSFQKEINEKEGRELRDLMMYYDDNENDEDTAVANNLILDHGDPYSILSTDGETGCMYLTNDQLPKNANGLRGYLEHCGKRLL